VDNEVSKHYIVHGNGLLDSSANS